MKGILKEKTEIALGTLRVVFDVAEQFSFQPGQYCFITIKDLTYPDERGPKRHFSIVNSPNEKGIITFTTRITESGFKKTLNELPEETEMELGPIAGTFVLPENTDKPLVFIAGGIGITPFMSILSFVTEQKLPYNITLIYSNRNQASTAYLNKLQSLALENPNIKIIFTMTDDPAWQGEKRQIDANFLKGYFPNVGEPFYMVVGPPPMTEAMKKSLAEIGVSLENIKAENFTGY